MKISLITAEVIWVITNPQETVTQVITWDDIPPGVDLDKLAVMTAKQLGISPEDIGESSRMFVSGQREETL